MTFQKKLWTALCVMALFSPLGIYLPQLFGAEDAWGEWSTEALQKMLGYVPEELGKLADIWKAPVPDYNLYGEGASFGMQALSYVISALIGIIVCAAAIYMIVRLLRSNEK